MYKVKTHAATNAKTMAMMGKLLKDADFIKLLKMNNIRELVDYLKKNTHYETAFNNDELDYENMEHIMKHHMFTYFEKFFHFYIDEYRNFFKALMLRYEVENIKLFLRAILREEDSILVKNRLISSDIYSSVDYDKISKSSDIKEFIESLKDTIYYDVLINYVDENPSKILFYMEMMLDRLYFNQLYESILKLKKEDTLITLDLYGINVDLLNVQWIYRGRKYFDISSEELFNFTLNNGKRYNFKKLKEFCYLDLDKFKDFILTEEYKALFTSEEFLMERDMERFIYYKLDEYIKKEKMSIIVPIVFIFKVEYEMRDLFTIIEGLRYELPNIKDFLVRNLERRE